MQFIVIFSVGFNHPCSFIHKFISILSCLKNPYTDSVTTVINCFKLVINFAYLFRYIYFEAIHAITPFLSL